MHMLRRALSLLLVATLVLGWTGAIAAADCGGATGKAAAGLAVAPGGCGTCGDSDEKGQPQQGCAVLACTAGCVSGPATAAEIGPAFLHVMDARSATPALHDAMIARAVPPDPPPPR